MARDEQNRSAETSTSRDRYRDNDDARDTLAADDRAGTTPDTKSEARGDARENVGNTARGTAARPSSGGNDRTKGRGDAPAE